MAITAAHLMVKVDGDSKGAEAALNRTNKSIGSMTAAATKGSMVLGGALAAGLVGATLAGSNFEKAMTQSTAIMSVSNEEMAQMEDVARRVGKTTTWSAKEAADSYYYLASAGLDAKQSMAALEPMARFATAGQFDMATATDLLTDAQSALGMTIRDDAVANMENMVRVSDTLVKANVLANASVEQFSEALTNKAGASLRTVGKDVEEGTAVLAAFADQGLKGRSAGEALYMVTRDLQTAALKNADAFKKAGVAVYDGSGEMRNYADIVGELEKRLGPMSDAQKKAELAALGFTDRSQGALLTLMGTSENIRRYEGELRKAGGTTDSVANKQVLNLRDQLKILANKLTDVGITIYDKFIEPLGAGAVAALSGFADKVGWVAENFGKIDPAILAAIGGAILGGLVPAFVALAGAIWTTMAPLIPFLAAGAIVGVAVGGIIKAMGGIDGVKAKLQPATDAWAAFKAGFSGDMGAIESLDADQLPIMNIGMKVKMSLEEAKEAVLDFAGGFTNWFAIDENTIAGPWTKAGAKVGEFVNNVKTFLSDLWTNLQPLRDAFATAFGGMQEAFGPVLEKLKTLFADLLPVFQVVGAVVGGVLAAALASLAGHFMGLMNALAPLVSALLGLFSIVANVFKLIVGIVTGDGAKIKDAFDGIAQGILDVFAGLWGAVAGYIEGFVTGVIEFFKGLWDTLVGHSIIPDMIQAIVDWFAKLPKMVVSAVAAFVTTVVKRFTDLSAKAKAKASEIVSGAVSRIKELPAKVAAGLSGLWAKASAKFTEFKTRIWDWVTTTASAMVGKVASIGRAIADGIRQGVSNTWDGLVSKLRGLVDLLPKAVKKMLGISSPSKVMELLGKQTVAGLVKGLSSGEVTKLKTAAGKMADIIKKAAKLDVSDKRVSAAKKILSREVADLKVLAKAHEKVTEKIADGKKALAALRDERKKFSQSIAAGLKGSLTSMFGPEGDVPDRVAVLKAGLQERLSTIKRFTADMETLRKRGVDARILREMAEAGVEQSGLMASQLAEASKTDIAAVNSLYGQLNKTAERAGKSTAAQFYDAGVKAAEGLVKGLKAQESKIDKQMEKMSKSLVRAIKKALGIKSPSTVFEDIGGNVAAGLVRGMDAMRDKAADAAQNLIPLPSSPGGRSAAYAPSGGGATYSFAGATFVVQVPDGKVATFEKQLAGTVRAGERRGRLYR